MSREFKDFLRQRRDEIGISQGLAAKRLTEYGYETSDGRVGHWETGRNKPPLDNPQFRLALALTLEMTINEMLSELGYVTDQDDLSPEAQLAAVLVEQLPAMGKKLAIEYLKILERQFSTSQTFVTKGQ